MKTNRLHHVLAGFAVLVLTANIARSEDKPSTNWVSSAAAGLTITSGNSESVLATLGFATARKWEKNELSFGADAGYGETKGQNGAPDTKSAEFARAFGQYNHLFTERFYGYLRGEAKHDGVAEIRYRAVISPGLGYYFIKNKTMDLSGEVGPGYVFENVAGDTHNYPILRVAEKFHYQLSDRARIWESAEWLPQATELMNYIVNAELGLEADLTADKKLAMRITLYDTFDNQPAPGLKKNDLKLVASLAYKF